MDGSVIVNAADVLPMCITRRVEALTSIGKTHGWRSAEFVIDGYMITLQKRERKDS